MDAQNICPSCQKPLEPNAPQGLCPQCLMQAGLGTGIDINLNTGPRRPAFVAPSPEQIAPLFPQLEILRFIGQGGMGAVYQARQENLERIVALKILPPGVGQNAAFAERFTREAKALARLNHPGVVTLHEFGQAGDLYYFIMEFVDGLNLRELIRTRRLSAPEALAIVPQICDALQFAHDQGIVHRDIKPENLLLDKQGRVKIADFGIAKMLGNEMTDPGKATTVVTSTTQSTLGTPAYSAPEQKADPGQADRRADIYSLGVVFYEMLTGDLPAQPFQPPSRKIQIDVRLDEVVLHALETRPERRYQQASEFKTMVETIAASSPPMAPLTSSPKAHAQPPLESLLPPKVNKQIRFVAWGLWAAGLLTVLGMLIGGIFLSIATIQLKKNARMHAQFAQMEIASSLKKSEAIEQELSLMRAHLRQITGDQQLERQELEEKIARTVELLDRTTTEQAEAEASLAEYQHFSVAHKWGPLLTYSWPLIVMTGLAVGILTMQGANRMRQMRQMWRAQTAGVLAMVVFPGMIVGLPCGLWALLLMARPDVSQVFANHSQLPDQRPPTAPPYVSLAVALTFVAPWFFGLTIYCFLNHLRGSWLIGSWVLAGLASPLLVIWLKHGLPAKASHYGFKFGAWLATLFSIGYIGFGVFFLNALISQSGKWNPAFDEAILVPLIWAGAIILPISAWRLWRAATIPLKTPESPQ